MSPDGQSHPKPLPFYLTSGGVRAACVGAETPRLLEQVVLVLGW